MRRPGLYLSIIAGLALALIGTGALASRNASGTYSLPSGNPVVSGTKISSTWANSTLSDIGTELTNSLDRGGRGAMTAPLPLSDGTVLLPGLTFGSDTNTGLYRIGADNPAIAAGGVKVQAWATTGSTFPLGITATQSQTNTAAVIATGNGNASGATLTGGSSGGHGLLATGGAVSGTGVNSTGGAPNGFGGDFTGTGAGVALRTNAGGLQIGASGTAITASYGSSYTINFGAITAGNCLTSSQTLTGVATGGVCTVSVDASTVHSTGTDIVVCDVTGANTVVISACALQNNTLGSGSYRVRVFQP